MRKHSSWYGHRTIREVRSWWFVLLIPLFLSSFAFSQQPDQASVTDTGETDTVYRVLLISSYHPGFPTFFRQIEGVRSAFSKAEKVLLDVEFMDSKRFGEMTGRKFLVDQLTVKLEKLPPYDAIMAADDNALHFVLDYQVLLFADTPVVFFGINDYETAVQLNSNLLVTGVVEAVSMAETIELMIELRHKAREIVALGDSTVSGMADIEYFETMADRFPDLTFRVLSLADHTFAEFTAELEKLDETSAVLLLSAYVDKEGNRLTFDQSLRLILSHLRQPLFHLWYHGIGDGALGGKVISHVDQGRVAADLVMRILAGEDIAGIPVVTESPNTVVLDYQVMERFALDERLVPIGATVLNLPQSFYRSHKGKVWLVAFLCLLQTTVIMVLVYAIYKKKIAERNLRESEERYFALFAKNHSVMILVDPETVSIVDANPAACAFYGYDREELVGMRVSGISVSSETDWLSLINEIDSSTPKQLEFKHRLASGEIREVEVFTGPIPLKGRKVFCSVIHDITDRKELEKQLLQAQKMEAIGTLAGGIAHDFNNILAAIIGYVELAKSVQYPGSEVDDYLRNVLTACGRARELVSQIMAYGRKEIGLRAPTCMGDVVEESLRLLRASLPATVEIETSLTEDECTVDANAGKLQQMVLNLGTNAFQAMEESGGVMSVRLERVRLKRGDLQNASKPLVGEYAKLSVIDTGMGIDPHIRSRIFDPYFTTKAGSKGSGLGLAVVTGIVQSLQGHITVDSEPGKGSRFDVYLPLCDRPVATAETKTPERLTGDERVLLVDDEPALIDILKQKLTQLGYRVTATTIGEQALQIFEDDPLAFDLVLTDQTMPGITGEVLARRVKRLRADIPVVISSGHSPIIEAESDESFVDAILNKPVEDKVLAATLRKLLDTYASGRG